MPGQSAAPRPIHASPAHRRVPLSTARIPCALSVARSHHRVHSRLASATSQPHRFLGRRPREPLSDEYLEQRRQGIVYRRMFERPQPSPLTSCEPLSTAQKLRSSEHGKGGRVLILHVHDDILPEQCSGRDFYTKLIPSK